MTAAALLRRANEAGVVVRVVDGKVKARGNPDAISRFVPELRAHRAELMELLDDTRESWMRLIAAATRACDFHGDDASSRERMFSECAELSPKLWDELRQHFEEAYPAGTSIADSRRTRVAR